MICQVYLLVFSPTVRRRISQGLFTVGNCGTILHARGCTVYNPSHIQSTLDKILSSAKVKHQVLLHHEGQTLRPLHLMLQGTNGGVTGLGLLASVLGGLFMGTVSYVVGMVSPSIFTKAVLFEAAASQWQLIPLGAHNQTWHGSCTLCV